MIFRFYSRIRRRLSLHRKKSNQDSLVDFIQNKENIEKAVEGSMQKRIDLIERVNLRKSEA